MANKFNERSLAFDYAMELLEQIDSTGLCLMPKVAPKEVLEAGAKAGGVTTDVAEQMYKAFIEASSL